MYEFVKSRPFILSEAIDTRTGHEDFRTFLRSYAEC
jgi:hypothetical protein